MKLLQTGPSPRGWHRLQLMIECPQKWAYRYKMDLDQRTDSAPLIKGSMMHLALAHHYMRIQARQQGTDPDEWMTPWDALEAICEKEGEAWAVHLDNIGRCYEAYCLQWIDEQLEIIAVEKMAYAKIGDHMFTGRFDLIYRDKRGKVWICDHKTTTRIQPTQKKFYGISGQLIGYAYLGHQIYGAAFGGMILNQIQHKNPFKFNRMVLPPAPNLLKRFPQVVEDTEKRIAELEASGRPFDQWPLAINELTCYSRYGPCTHLDRCKWGVGV